MALLTNLYALIAPSEIKVPEERQRSGLELDEGFLSSIRERGILMPILITHEQVLIAGARRHAAALSLGLDSVPCRYVEEGLDETLIAVIELEENIRREMLSWQDEAKAVKLIHEMWVKREEGWTQEKTKRALSLQSTLHLWLRVARALEDEEEREKLKYAIGLRSAYNICVRIDERKRDAILETLNDFSNNLFSAQSERERLLLETERDGDSLSVGEVATAGSGDGVSPPLSSPTTSPPSTTPYPFPRAHDDASRAEEENVLCLNFIPWARAYDGPRFNFIHCDFPYGKKVFAAEWGGKRAEEEFKYDDDRQVYWNLCRALCEERNRLFTSSAHLMFWTSADISNLHETIEFFRAHAPDFIFQARVLVWHKSDNAGIVHDARRRPRWTYETALMATRGDRVLVKPLAASYSAPTARTLHPSTKPEPVLRHFFGMFVDATTRLLDPTCGSGSALRAAESLGAQSVLGLDSSPDFVKSARKALRDFRLLREFTQAHKGG
jgi:ParB-like nuclease domain